MTAFLFLADDAAATIGVGPPTATLEYRCDDRWFLGLNTLDTCELAEPAPFSAIDCNAFVLFAAV